MSDVNRDPDADWALASAYLDDDVDAVERATVDADPTLLALVERLTGVRATLAVTSPPPPSQRDTAIAAALAAFDDTAHLEQPIATTATVQHLDAHRSRRLRWFSGAAAAAVVAVLVGVAVANRSDTGSDTAARPQPPAATFAGAAGAAPSTTAAAATTTAAAATKADAGGAPESESAATTPRAASSSAPMAVLDEPEQLLTLAVPAGVDTAAVPAPSSTRAATTGVSNDADGTALAASEPCATTSEIVLAMIVYRGTPAVATLDVSAHVRRARSTIDCSILAVVADNP